MNDSLNNSETIRQYLLGHISDETMLLEIEELLFSDDEFCTKTEIVEDELINDFVFGKLNAEDSLSFEKTLETNFDRRAKVKVTQLLKEKATPQIVEEKASFFDSIKAFFRQPIYVGGFALLLIAILIGAILILRPTNNSELAELKNIYKEKRPFETRISEFDYAPFEVTRGVENLSDAEKRKLRLIETKMLEAVDKNPNGENHHTLGVFYLTQAKYADSIKELEQAVKLNDKNAQFQNDLGSAYFELSKIEKDKKLETLARANESFSKAFELNPNLLEALFNKALTLQSLNLPRVAKEHWELYLTKDSTSKWADEARKNLEKIAKMQSSFKTKEQVLGDFLNAYRNSNEEIAWKINCQTKEMISGVWLPDQLTRRYLQARKNKDEATAKESIKALTYIGNLERNKNADFFVSDLADYYANVGDEKIDDLLRAKELFSEGYKLAPQSSFQQAQIKFEEAKELLIKNGNTFEEKIAEYWIAFCLADIAKLIESQNILEKLKLNCEKRNYKWIVMLITTRFGDISFRQNEHSKAINQAKLALKLAEELKDTIYQQRSIVFISLIYEVLGDAKKSIFTLSKLFEIRELYSQGYFQNLRNLGGLFDKFKSLNFSRSSIDYAKEFRSIAYEDISNTAIIFDSEKVLAEMYLKNNDFENAERTILGIRTIVELMSDAKAKSIKDAYLDILEASSSLKQEKYSDSIKIFNTALQKIGDSKEFIPDLYIAQKGKLICFDKLNQNTEFENELKKVNKLYEENRNQILEEESRNSFFEQEQSFANIATDFFLKQDNSQKAFEYSENSKARSLLDLVENKGFYDQNEKQIIFKDSAQPFSIEQIQQKLSPNVQIIQYAVLEDKISVWLISNNQFEVVTTPIQTDSFEQKVKDYLDLVKNKSPQTKQISKELFDILLKPILAKLDKTKQLCIVPDGILYHLPFASLVSIETEKYLIEDFAIFYSQSATTSIILSEKAKSKTQKENLLVVGNPEFNREQNTTLQNLESAEKEATEIAKFYDKPTKLIKSQATKAEVLANFSKANVFHFAGHYVANPNSSLNSKLLLAQPINSIDEFEGELRASEILQIPDKSNLKLAVLSACETGIERYYKGEGAIGMARTFLAIGTPIVVASQWKVESESTAELMRIFHRNRKEKGLITSEALRQAQLEMLAKTGFSEPYFWSAFSVVGGNGSF